MVWVGVRTGHGRIWNPPPYVPHALQPCGVNPKIHRKGGHTHACTAAPVSAPGRWRVSGAVRGVLGVQRCGAGLHRADAARLQQQSIGAAHCQLTGHHAGGHLFHGGLPCAGARLAVACYGGVGAGAADAVFAQLPGGGRNHRVRCRRHVQLQLVPGGRYDLPACRAGKDQLYFNAGTAFKPCARQGEPAQKPAAALTAHRYPGGAHPYPG